MATFSFSITQILLLLIETSNRRLSHSYLGSGQPRPARGLRPPACKIDISPGVPTPIETPGFKPNVMALTWGNPQPRKVNKGLLYGARSSRARQTSLERVFEQSECAMADVYCVSVKSHYREEANLQEICESL